ncbi:MAG: CoA transferase subunit A [Elusimicrobiales bacterium]|nr:CoA transferase subunit A [Elusimicrobiales bacterium]
MKRLVSADEAVSGIKDGASVMLGGFMCCGQPFGLIDALLRTGAKNLTVISNDGGTPCTGVAKLIEQQRVARLIASHIGLNPEAGRQMNAGTLEVDLVPQGTLAERIRAAGAGLGGVVTPTGIGTEVEKGKQKISVDGREYLLEKPLRAEFAFIRADIADKFGNIFIAKAQKNFNPVMAMAAQTTIVEAEKIVELGGLDPDDVTLPGVFVHTIVEAGK